VPPSPSQVLSLRSRAPATADVPAGQAPPTAAPPASPHPHLRLIAGAVAVLGVVLLAAILMALSGGSGEPAPVSTSAELVPSDALVYIHLSTDPARPAVKRMDALMARLPDHGAAIDGYATRVIDEVGGSTSTSYARDIRPWLGQEAAFAILDTTGGQAGSLALLQVRDRARATALIRSRGALPIGSYGGDRLYRYPTGVELAFVHNYLAVGQDAAVRAAIDASRGRLRSLKANPGYARASSDEPAGRVLDAYISAGGVARVLAPRQDILGALSLFDSSPSLLGTAISVSAAAPGLAVHIHSALDPKRAKADASRPQPFTPTLQNVLPAGSTLMLDARNLSAAAPTVMSAIGRIGLLSGVPGLLRRLGSALTAQGFDVHRLLSLFDGETAVGLATGSGAPALVIVTRTTNEAAARIELAGLDAPLVQLFAPAASAASGIEPEVNDIQVGAVTAHQIQLAPGLQLDDAVFNGLVVVSTSLRGITDVATRSRALAADPGFRAVLGQRPGQVTSLGFADFSQLLSLAEQSTLGKSAGFRSLEADLSRIRAAGMDSTRGEADTTAELYLQIP
jgi:hypothetical protein